MFIYKLIKKKLKNKEKFIILGLFILLVVMYLFYNSKNTKESDNLIDKVDNVVFNEKKEKPNIKDKDLHTEPNDIKNIRDDFFSEIRDSIGKEFSSIHKTQEEIDDLIILLGDRYDMKDNIDNFIEIIEDDKYLNQILTYKKEKDSTLGPTILKNFYLSVQNNYSKFTYFADIKKFEKIFTDDDLYLLIELKKSIEDKTLPNGMIVTSQIRSEVLERMSSMKDNSGMTEADLSESILNDILIERKKSESSDIKKCYEINDSIKQLECLEN